ncbi:riboflavin synthase subunit alpha [Robertmurraya siralis]|uniref:Riboflavin synthase n=1 Tax=Robertmurraya siralis TaxID=77777 RepID=A0A920BU85_9BACI|nr:riboflavin synthase [Robertmurraya siralis]PAE20980.1 riboflavin synthase [Bacillus sp. 7504-2]GIN62704.1 riboflavin synthase subunit alpha [Robertmurraya siralis]
MFTGIIEELGRIESIQSKGNTLILAIQGKRVLEGLNIGDSISVNGVCLTVTNFSQTSFFVDVMPETFKSTSLSMLQRGSLVNLERALAANGRFGGHFVTGHVDTVGQISKREQKENAIYIELTFPNQFNHLALYKGSVALDGTSLTIFGNEHNRLTVSLIPHTVKESVVGLKKIGDQVNIEFDMIGKYLFSFFQSKEIKRVSIDLLKENGFM